MDLLLVEDDPTDRMVIHARLRRAFPSWQIIAADDLLGFNEHLRREVCDVVVTDYWLGWSDGLSVLQRVRERWPQVRVIMLTGNGGEEVVAGAFKYGLYRYLLKPDGFDDLASVTGAAMESKRREDSHRLMAMIVNAIPDGVHCVDPAGIITATNAAACRMYGYADFEIVGRTNEILLPSAKRDEIRRMLERALGGEIVPAFPTLQMHSDGAEIAVAMTMLPMRDGDDGAVLGVVCIATPIGRPIRQASGATANEANPPRLAMSLTSH